MVAAAEIRIANTPLIILEGKIQILSLPERFLLQALCFVLLAALLPLSCLFWCW